MSRLAVVLVLHPSQRKIISEASLRLRIFPLLQSHTNVTVEIEGEDKPALVADWIGLIYFA